MLQITEVMDTIAGRSEQAGILVATASVPSSFQRTLMPRTTADQAIITGTGMAVSYGLAVFTHDMIEALAHWTRPEVASEAEDHGWRRRTAAIDAGAWVAGWMLRIAFKQRPGESLMRGALRTAGIIVTRTALSGVFVAALQEAAQIAETRIGTRRLGNLPIAVLGGAGVAAGDQFISRFGMNNGRESDAEERWHVATGKAMAIGGMVASGLFTIATAERGLARSLSDRLTTLLPGRERGWRPVGHVLALGAIASGMAAALHRVYTRIEGVASTFEPGIEAPPVSESVSGGPGSVVPYDTLSRQGWRHVHTYARREWIERVMGEPAKANPIRVFVGLDSATSEEDRVELAMKELERTGAFDRSLLLVVSPTGTGYVNYAAVESVEYLTRGDCATVTMQYSKRPSPLSLGRIDVGRDQTYMLLQAIHERLQDMPSAVRPRFVLFGESLGAHTSQDAFVHRGTRGLLDRGLDGALWIGTPYRSLWKEEVLGKARFDVDRSLVGVFNSIDELDALEAEQRVRLRYIMLTHNNDAVAYFGPEILLACPHWLGDPETRPAGVPRSARYRPIISFLQTLIDMKNSANVIPGQFEANGHDYRADLARFVRKVFGLDATDEQMAQIERALRDFELARAEWIAHHREQKEVEEESA